MISRCGISVLYSATGDLEVLIIVPMLFVIVGTPPYSACGAHHRESMAAKAQSMPKTVRRNSHLGPPLLTRAGCASMYESIIIVIANARCSATTHGQRWMRSKAHRTELPEGS